MSKAAYIITIILAGWLAGCGPPSTIHPDHLPEEGQIINDGQQAGVVRVIDGDAGVVCYRTYSALDCLPISETKLKR